VHLSKASNPEFFVIGAPDLAGIIKPEKAYWYVDIKDLVKYRDQRSNLGLT
jgi:hypothetical protein